MPLGAAPPYLCLWRRNFCAAGGVLFSYSGAIFGQLKVFFIVYGSSKYACLALPVLRDVITLSFFKNSHKAPLKSPEHLRLREQRRQPLQKFSQKAPQSPALNSPSTARTAGRSDWAERRFRRQPFILLSFSSSKKARKVQQTQSYQHFQHTGHTDFNTSGTNGPRSLSWAKVRTHSPLLKGSHTRAYTLKQGRFGWGRYYYPRTVSHVSETLRGQGAERQTLPLLGLGRVCSRRTQKAFGTAMRLCVSLSRGVAAPLGCVICLQLGDVAVFSLCAQYFLNVRGGGGITTLGAFRTFTNIPGPGIRTAYFAALGSWPGVLPKNTESLRDSDALMRVAVPRRRGPAGLRDLFATW